MNVRLTTLSIAFLAGVASAAPSWKPLTPSMTSMADFFVSPDGNDMNPGTPDKPLATLEGARIKVRQFKTKNPGRPVIVEFAAGTYRFDKTVSFTKEDSGSKGAPVVYRGVYGGETRFTGSQAAPALKTLQDASVEALLLPEAKGRVKVLVHLPGHDEL